VSTSIGDLNLTGKALTPGAQRGWWLREALAAETDAEPRPLKGDVNADVVIVGGGFTGLWTAYHLVKAKPDLKVVLLEQDICGGGPSGRNGGFASGWWDELDGLITLYGREPAVRACRAIGESINAIGEFCEAHGVDAWYKHAGYAYAATASQHEAICHEIVGLAREVGAPEELSRSAHRSSRPGAVRRRSAQGRSCETGPPCSRRCWPAASVAYCWSWESPSTRARL
jgi:hypothetical protein